MNSSDLVEKLRQKRSYDQKMKRSVKASIESHNRTFSEEMLTTRQEIEAVYNNLRHQTTLYEGRRCAMQKRE